MFAFPFLSSLTSHLGVTALDESVDTLSCFITAFIFLFSALMISAKTNVGTPIECWLPQTYSGPWEEYSENYCFLKDTYWYPTNVHMSQISNDHKERYRLKYYQWSSMYLTMAALIFMIPKFLWKTSQPITDMPILYFCDTANEICTGTAEKRKEKVKEMAELLRGKITVEHAPFSMARIRPTFIYAFVKILYLVIAFLQFVALAHFLGQGNDVLWGWTLAKNLYKGVTWETTGLFPRVTFCDFNIHEMAGNIREETIECVLGINEFNEKIFLFLWFWLVLVFVLTFLGNIYKYFTYSKKILVNSLLHNMKDIQNRKHKFADFAENFLKNDGQLVLNYVKSQSDRVAEELTMQMFHNYEIWREENPDPRVSGLTNGLKSDGDLEKGKM